MFPRNFYFLKRVLSDLDCIYRLEKAGAAAFMAFCCPKGMKNLAVYLFATPAAMVKSAIDPERLGNIVSRFHTERCTVFLGVSGFCWEIFTVVNSSGILIHDRPGKLLSSFA